MGDQAWAGMFAAKRRRKPDPLPVITPTEEIAALILPWAEANHPEKHAATLAVQSQPRTYRRYLIRLLEIRWEEDSKTWRNEIPLSVLDESAVRMTTHHRATGTPIHVGGRLARIPPPDVSFGMLSIALKTPDPQTMLLAMATATALLDLERYDPRNPSPVT